MVLLDYTSSRLLRELSQNSRQSFSELGRKLGVSGATVARRVKALEGEYGLKYVVEADKEALGLTASYIVTAKLSRLPPAAELRRIFKKHPEAQYAAITKGDFDLFAYATSSKHEHMSRWANWVRQELNEWLEEWSASNVIGNWFGFFPLRDELLEDVPVGEPKKSLLLLLNRNARAPLKELAEELGLSMSTTQYHLKQLVGSRYVKRFTMVMTRPPANVHYIIMWKYAMLPDYMEYGVRARKTLLSAERKNELASLVLAANTMGMTDDVVIKMFDSIRDAQEFDERIGKSFGPVVVGHRSAFIVEDIVGNLPARNLDVKREYQGEWGIYDYLRKARP